MTRATRRVVCVFFSGRLNVCLFVRFSEMRDGPGENVAHGTLFLCPVRQTVRRGGIPRARRSPVLSGRLLRHVRSQVRRMQSAHNGKLRVCPINAMAFQLFRVQGKGPLPFHCYLMFSVIATVKLVVCSLPTRVYFQPTFVGH